MPSTKGYVVRPKWNTDQEFHSKRGSKKPLDRYEKHLRKKKQEKMQSRTTHAVPISVEGRHMPL
jgi:transcription factor SPN1